MKILVVFVVSLGLLLPLAHAQTADEAWSLYADAYEATLVGDAPEAAALLERLQREYPDSEAAKRASRARRLAAPPKMETAHRDLGKTLRNEEPVPLARAELAIVQTFNGIGVGLSTCGLLPCSGLRPYVVSSMLGGAAGLGASLYLSRDGITQGHALAINSGSVWGAVHAGLLSLALSTGENATSAMLLVGQLGGTAVGHYAWSAFGPGAGDVSAMNSGGVWAIVISLLVQSAAQANLSNAAFFGTMLAAADLGLIGGGILASYMPMSRSRTLVIDAGGILGLLLGFAANVLIEGTSPSDRNFFGLGALGATAGLVSATLLTQNWDLDALPAAQLAILPNDGGATLMAGMSW